MEKLFLFLIFLFATFCPGHAQWQKRTLHGLKKVSTQTLASRTLATQRAINQALRNKTNILLKSTFPLKLSEDGASTFSSWEYPHASAFVFEEKYNGKTYLWGVTATHYYLEEPSLEDPQTGKEIPIQLLAQGHRGRNDVSLFAIPSSLQKQFTPLKLAAHSPKEGEKLFSAGYFEDGFHVEKNRIVKAILPNCILTSLVVKDRQAREGACGGPVLNKKGEIVGMHVGSSQKQIGFVVPVEHIYELLQAYHNNGKSLRPLYFNGRQIGNLNINEHLHSIEVWKGNKKIQDFFSYPYRAHIEYDHLENLVDASSADRLVFIIERTPFSMLEKDQHTYQFKITYDLHTFYVSERKRL